MASVALIVIGFALGLVTDVSLNSEQTLALLGGAVTLLLLASRAGRGR